MTIKRMNNWLNLILLFTFNSLIFSMFSMFLKLKNCQNALKHDYNHIIMCLTSAYEKFACGIFAYGTQQFHMPSRQKLLHLQFSRDLIDYSRNLNLILH